jgi:hypothetical protein
LVAGSSPALPATFMTNIERKEKIEFILKIMEKTYADVHSVSFWEFSEAIARAKELQRDLAIAL